jgi:hypothetical protein
VTARAAIFLPIALCALASACADGPTSVDPAVRPRATRQSTAALQGQWTTIEGFEAGSLAAYTMAGGADAGATDAAYAHDGSAGLRTGSATWIYRNDEAVRVSQGDKLSAWVRFGDVSSDNYRAYLGFGASPAGALSLTVRPNAGGTGAVFFQEHANYNFSGELPGSVAAPVAFVANQWYRVEVIWGAGGSLVGNVYGSDGTTLLGTATATSTLITSGGIAFRDNFGGNAFDTVQRFGPAANGAPQLNAIGTRQATEGSALTFTATASDPNGDALTFSLVGAPSGASIDPTTGVFTWTPADGPAATTFTVVVSDGTLTDSEAVTVNVANAAPAVTAGPNATVAPRTAHALAAAFTDPGALDGPWAYTVTWGDGSAATAGKRTAAGAIPATHTYEKNGTYTVTVSVTDKDGGVGRASYTVTVAQSKPRR